LPASVFPEIPGVRVDVSEEASDIPEVLMHRRVVARAGKSEAVGVRSAQPLVFAFAAAVVPNGECLPVDF
jgi:hypothetical protein